MGQTIGLLLGGNVILLDSEPTKNSHQFKSSVQQDRRPSWILRGAASCCDSLGKFKTAASLRGYGLPAISCAGVWFGTLGRQAGGKSAGHGLGAAVPQQL